MGKALIAAVLACLALGACAQTDFDILNFALNIECAEATFYSFSLFGTGLNSTLTKGGPAPLGGAKTPFTPLVGPIALEIALDEIKHVAFLRGTLGDAGVPCPEINVGTVFNTIVQAALGITTGNFNAYQDELHFLLSAYLFEDVGVTAFHGALAAFTNKTILTDAGGLEGVEAYHAGILRTLLYQRAAEIVEPYNIQVAEFVEKLSELRKKLDGTGNDDFGIIDPPATGNSIYLPFKNPSDALLVPIDPDGLVFARSVDQVKAIVLGGLGNTKGGFFPNGLNGLIK